MDSRIRKRFFKYVHKTEHCWFWIGGIGDEKEGYGNFTGPERKAHRMSWLLHRGKIPKNMLVLHRCDIPPCVNPDHLFLGTKKDNAQDRTKKGRQFHPDKRGIKHHNAKLTETEVRAIINSKELQRVIASKYGISPSYVSILKSRKGWKHI